MPEPNAGDELAGRYVLREVLGRGGFGVVWRATDERRGREVALKHPNHDGRADAGLVDRYFDREVDVLEEIRDVGGHPNIMTYYGRERGFGLPFIVVELIEGEELGEVVRSATRFTDADEVRRIGVGTCDALSFLHDHDIIYRDLKPDNIMVEADRTPKIIDFTTAKGFVDERGAPAYANGGTRAASGGRDSTVPGEFNPPELNQGAEQRQGPWSDVYSVGKLLCFLLVGWVPDDDAVSPTAFGVDCPAYLDEIIETATRHDRTDRYPNASVLRGALADRDPTMPVQAAIEWLGRDERWTISPGDSVGRHAPDGPTPSIALDDREHRALSAVHCRFDVDTRGRWKLVDTSLNGTYVSKHDEREWRFLLSAAGQRRQREVGGTVAGNPATEVYLEDGDTVALVSPEYPERFYFRFDHDAKRGQ